MYFTSDLSELLLKHRDFCGDIGNHIEIIDVVPIEPIEYIDEDGEVQFWNGEEVEDWQVVLWECEVHMGWIGSNDTVYVYPEVELESPDDWDSAKEYVVSQVS